MNFLHNTHGNPVYIIRNTAKANYARGAMIDWLRGIKGIRKNYD